MLHGAAYATGAGAMTTVLFVAETLYTVAMPDPAIVPLTAPYTVLAAYLVWAVGLLGLAVASFWQVRRHQARLKQLQKPAP